MFNFISKISRTTIVASIIVIIIIISGAGYAIQQKNKPPQYETINVTKGNIQQTVNVTGKVVAAEEIDLAFEKGGRIGAVNVKVGDIVEKDAVLAQLSSADEQASVAEARANVASAEAALNRYVAAVESAKANLAELEKGSRPEEVTLARSKVTKAEQAAQSAAKDLTNAQATADLELNNLYEGVVNLVNTALNHADEAVNQQADQVFNFPYGRPLLNFTTSNNYAQNSAETNMELSKVKLTEIKTIAANLPTTQPQTDQNLTTVLANLNLIKTMLIDVSACLSATNNLPPTTEATYAADIATARTNINSDISAITTRQQAIATQKNTNTKNIDAAKTALNAANDNLTIAQNELSLTLAGATKEQVDSAKAAVQQAEANLSVQRAEVSRAYAALQRQNSELSKNSLLAPFKGIITDVNVTAGEIVAANGLAISMISDGQFEIEANIPEADIANIKVGDMATFTLDAFNESETFNATVGTIDPAETITEGVSTYKIKLVLDSTNTAAKPGMTANVTIVTAEKNDALIIPIRLIEKDGLNNVVQVLNENGIATKVIVTLGLRDSSGNVEIVSGLNDGQKIIVPQSN